MLIETACSLVSNLIYKPGWRFECEDFSARFGDYITVKIIYPAVNYNRDQAPEYKDHIEIYATWPLLVSDTDDAKVIYARILDFVLLIEEHEAREALRVRPTMWAPFHPHHLAGMQSWLDHLENGDDHMKLFRDLKFGIS